MTFIRMPKDRLFLSKKIESTGRGLGSKTGRFSIPLISTSLKHCRRHIVLKTFAFPESHSSQFVEPDESDEANLNNDGEDELEIQSAADPQGGVGGLLGEYNRNLPRWDVPLGISRVTNSSHTPAQSLGQIKPIGSGNRYFDIVAKIAPNDLSTRFMETSSKRVQDAARVTVLGLLGSLPKYSLETTVLTTGDKLASLVFQLQMTGYMLQNADYRLSLSESLRSVPASDYTKLRKGGSGISPSEAGSSVDKGCISPSEYALKKGKEYESSTELTSLGVPEVSGNLTLTLPDGNVLQVDAASYMSELRHENAELREEASRLKTPREYYDDKDLLLYIKALPEIHMRSLTENVNEDVLDAMRRFTSAVVEGLGGLRGGESITQQTGSAMAQLCLWQLAVGYNLRELEIREDMTRLFDSQ